MIGIIGTGWGTRVQVPAFAAAGLKVGALAARDRDKTRREAEQAGIGFWTDDWRELLQRDDVQFVSIVTPPHTHREIAIAALRAGKHVLCEKPMALNADETQAMVDAAAQHSTQYAIIDHELRFLPSFQLARQRLERGDLGALRHVESSVLGGGRADPNRAWNWWSDAEQGGGILGAIGSHQFDALQWLIGPIAAVSGVTHTFIAERPGDDGPRRVSADDYSAVLLRFADGGLGSITLSVVAATSEPNRMTLQFEGGALRIEDWRVLEMRRGGDWRDVTPADTVDIPSQLADGGAFQRGSVYLGHALRNALSGDCTALAPAATWHDGHRVQQLLDAVRRSNRSGGGWIELDAV
jgi:predicted dehydrogenase